MKNIYIDLGAYDGDTVEQFRNWSKVTWGELDWEIYAFEINPRFNDGWIKREDEHTHFENKAAWVEDGELEVAIDQSDLAWGSTAMSGKVSIWDTMPHLKVPCFDFSTWLKQFENENVVVKMDIEGAEFPILEKMLKDGTAQIPETMMVEFHPNKVQEYTTTHKEKLVRRLLDAGCNVKEWH